MDKESVLLDSEDRMDKALGALDRDFSRLRTGRASTGLVDNIKVDYYGTPTPISQLASVAIPDSRTITIQPWDRGAFASVEKAILKSDLGLTPVNDGKIIRISIPPLTEDRRKELGKLARKSGEEAKVAVRNVRRDANDQLKKLEKDKAISEDELKKATDDVQKLTDRTKRQLSERGYTKENMPEYAVTMGIKTLTEARNIILLAGGEDKAAAVFEMVYGKTITYIPASFLQIPTEVTVYLDTAAASRL